MYIYIHIYAHVDTLFTCYLFYYVLLSYHLFVEFGQSYGTHQVPTQDDIYRGANDITNEAAETEEDSPNLGTSQAYGPVNSHYGPFSLKKLIFPKSKTKSVFCREPTTVFSFGQLSFSPLFLFMDVLPPRVRTQNYKSATAFTTGCTRKYVYYIYI